MLSPRLHNAGVTLIELIVTMSIVGILAGLAVPSFKTWMMNLKISTSAEIVLNGLQLARAEAVRRNAQVQFVQGTGSTWTVGCVTVTATCPGTIQSSSSSEGLNGVVTVTATPSSATTVAFNSFGAVSNAATTFSQLDIDLPSSVMAASDTRNLRIVVSTGGTVRLCDPNLVSPDARAC